MDEARYCAMQHIKRGSITIQGVPLAYADQGRGPPVVYLHGALTTLEEGLIGLSETLAPCRRLIAFDRPGHGSSGVGAGTGSLWRQASLVREALAKLGVERPVMVGHSFGGAVAAAYGLAYADEVAGVVALAPIAFPEARLEQMIFGLRAAPGCGPWLNALAGPWDEMMLPALWRGMFLPQAMTGAFQARFPFAEAARRSQLRADGEEALMMAGDLARSALRYGSASVRLRVVQGDRDTVVDPMRHGRLLAALWPDAAFVTLPGLGHMAHHFAPEAVLAAIEAVEAAAVPEPLAA